MTAGDNRRADHRFFIHRQVVAALQQDAACFACRGAQHGLLVFFVQNEDGGIVKPESLSDQTDDLLEQIVRIQDRGCGAPHVGAGAHLRGAYLDAGFQRIDQIAQTGCHGIKGSRQCANLVALFNFRNDLQIAPCNLCRNIGQMDDRPGDGARD